MARNAAYNSLAVIPGFEPVYQKMKELGYGEINFDRLRERYNDTIVIPAS